MFRVFQRAGRRTSPTTSVASCNFSSLLIEVDNEVTATNHDIRLAGRPAHDRTDAGDKLVLVKGLCQIVVRAEGQCLNLVPHIGKPGNNQNWRLYLTVAQLTQHIVAGDIR